MNERISTNDLMPKILPSRLDSLWVCPSRSPPLPLPRGHLGPYLILRTSSIQVNLGFLDHLPMRVGSGPAWTRMFLLWALKRLTCTQGTAYVWHVAPRMPTQVLIKGKESRPSRPCYNKNCPHLSSASHMSPSHLQGRWLSWCCRTVSAFRHFISMLSFCALLVNVQQPALWREMYPWIYVYKFSTNKCLMTIQLSKRNSSSLNSEHSSHMKADWYFHLY